MDARFLCILGFFTEVTGPNIPYLQSRISGSYSDIAISLGSRGAGSLFGALIGGLLCEVSPKWLDLWVSSSLILGALCTSAVPWSTHIIHLCLTLGLCGFSKGFLQVATITLALRMLTAKRMQCIIFLLHMAYALGATPCAQLAYLFDTGVLEQLLLGKNTTDTVSPTYINGHEIVADAVLDESPEKNTEKFIGLLDHIPRPMYPFDIAAVLTFVCGAVFLVFFGSSIRSVPGKGIADVTNKVEDAEAQSIEEKPQHRCFVKDRCGLRAFLSVIVFFVLPTAILSIFGTFHHLYLVHSVDRLVKSQALLIQTIFWGSVALGRLIPLITRRCLAPNGLVISCLTMSVLSTALILAYGQKFPVFIWIFTFMLGLFTGPVLPAGMTFGNICLSPTAIGVMMAFSCQAIGDGAFSWTAGFLLHRFPPQYLVYTVLASVGLSFLLYLPIIPILARQRPGKQQPLQAGI